MKYLEGRFIYGDNVYIDDYYLDEQWSYISNFPDYMISDKARVWSTKTQRFIKVKPMDDHGHLGVCLVKDGKRCYKYIHRLVAEAFIPNPKQLPIVRHLNDCTYDNSIDNLAWGTQRDNIYDSIVNGKNYVLTDNDRELSYNKSRTPIKAINLDSGETFIFKGQGDASRKLGIPQSNIWKVLRGVRSKAQGYIFEYLERGVSNV